MNFIYFKQKKYLSYAYNKVYSRYIINPFMKFP